MTAAGLDPGGAFQLRYAAPASQTPWEEAPVAGARCFSQRGGRRVLLTAGTSGLGLRRSRLLALSVSVQQCKQENSCWILNALWHLPMSDHKNHHEVIISPRRRREKCTFRAVSLLPSTRELCLDHGCTGRPRVHKDTGEAAMCKQQCQGLGEVQGALHRFALVVKSGWGQIP